MPLSETEIRAALNALDTDPDPVLAQLADRDIPEDDVAHVRHAALIGLLYRAIGKELRETVTATDGIDHAMRRVLATHPQYVPLPDEEPLDQARFEASWLKGRVNALAAAETDTGEASPMSPANDVIDAVMVLLDIELYRRTGLQTAEELQTATVRDRLDAASAALGKSPVDHQ